MEHHSNLVPWQILCQQMGAELAYVPVTDDGLLDIEALGDLLAPPEAGRGRPLNVLGTVNPIAEIAELAHAAGALLMIDGAQAVPHLPVDIAALGADFYAWTGHKAYGPTGIGVLHGRRDLLEAMPPFLGGGHMITRVGERESTYAEPPARFEAGTMPVAEAIGLETAVDYLSGLGMDAVWEHSRDVAGYAVERLRTVPGLELHGPAELEHRGSLASFSFGRPPARRRRDPRPRRHLHVRAGHHCAQPLMRRLGVPASSRASFAVHTTREDVDRLIEGLEKVRGCSPSHGRPLPRADPRALQAAP